MTAEELDECRTCGAYVAKKSRHRAWHEALSQLMPGLEDKVAELNTPASEPFIYTASSTRRRGYGF